MSDDSPDAECVFCGKMLSVEEAIEAGWFTSFWRGGSEVSCPICEGCSTEHCDFGDEGEPVLKPGHAIPNIPLETDPESE